MAQAAGFKPAIGGASAGYGFESRASHQPARNPVDTLTPERRAFWRRAEPDVRDDERLAAVEPPTRAEAAAMRRIERRYPAWLDSRERIR